MPGDTVRIGFIVLLGFALALAVVWYIHYCYQEILGTAEVVIDPLTVIDDTGKRNQDLGGALALMLQERLGSLREELRDAQAGLASIAPGSATRVVVSRVGPEDVVAPVGGVRLWAQDVALHTGLLEPVEMKLAVGGVEVGGVIPWLQRRVSNRRTLHFTVYSHGDQAQVFGSLAALRLGEEGLRLAVKSDDGKAPSLDLIIDRLAHEIVRRRLAQDASNQVRFLRPAEFVTLSTVLVSAAQSNSGLLHGRPTENEFASLLPDIKDLSDKVPDWPELSYLTALLADKAKDSATASVYYNRVVLQFDAKKQDKLIALIKQRLENIVEIESPLTTTSTGPVQPLVDYSSDIKHVRDSGPEGSVVGQALGAAMEAQLVKETHQDYHISARYIYYVARGASTSFDSGARIEDGIKALSKKGAVAEEAWPYVAGQYAEKPPASVEKAEVRFRITNAKSLKGLNAVKHALAHDGPVVAGIEVYRSAMEPGPAKTGIIPLPAPKEQIMGGHAIVVVGYDDKQKRIKFVNSWGTGWGDHGFGYLPYEYVEKYMDDAWTFKTTVDTQQRPVAGHSATSG